MDEDDEAAARIFRTLSDPATLRLLLHVLETGKWDSSAARSVDLTPRAAQVRLARLVDAGLLAPTDAEGAVLRIVDAPGVERLLATVRQLRRT